MTYENTVGLPNLRVAAKPLFFKAFKVRLPDIIFVTAEMVEILPAEDARIVKVIELNSYGVVANRLEFHHPNMPASRDRLLLVRHMALDLRGRTFDPQKLRRQFKKATVVKSDLKEFFSFAKCYFRRPVTAGKFIFVRRGS